MWTGDFDKQNGHTVIQKNPMLVLYAHSDGNTSTNQSTDLSQLKMEPCWAMQGGLNMDTVTQEIQIVKILQRSRLGTCKELAYQHERIPMKIEDQLAPSAGILHMTASWY